MRHKMTPEELRISMDKFQSRQGFKGPRGVHTALFPHMPGCSIAGYYVFSGGNVETCKRIHRDRLDEIRALRVAMSHKLPK